MLAAMGWGARGWGLCAGWVLAGALAHAPVARAAEPPMAVRGAIDITPTLAQGGIAPLDGQWSFVPRFVGPGEPWPAEAGLLAVPGTWNAAMGGSQGSGTYRVTIACPAAQRLALALPFQHSAAAAYANGRLVAQQGRPGETARQHEPGVSQEFTALDGVRCPVDLRIQVSNYELYRGGLMRSVQLGTPEGVAQRREQALTRSAVAVGVAGVVALFALMFFVARPRGRTALWLALFGASTAWGIGITGDRVLQPVVAALSFDGQMRLLFINWYIGLLLYPVLVASLYPRQANRTVLGVIAGFTGAGAAMSLVVPVRVFAASAPLLQAAAPVATLYAVWMLARAWRAREPGAAVVLAGLGLLVAAVTHDVVFYQHLLSANASPYGLMAVVLAPAVLLAQRLGRALNAEELRTFEQRERADLLVRATQAGVIDWDAASGVVRASERFREMFGLPFGPGEPDPPAFETLLHPDDRGAVMEAFRAQLRNRDAVGLRRWDPAEYRMLRADGRVLWVHAESISICGEDGRTLRYICTFIDITHLKATEEALATERERLRLLVRSTKAGFGDWDAVRDMVTYSDRFKEMLGYPADCDTSAWPSIFDMMHPDDRERAREEFRAMIRRKGSGGEQEPGVPMSYRLRRADGQYVWIHAEGIAQLDDTGRTVRFITSYLDVTAFHEQEQRLREQVELTRTEQRRLDLVVRGARVGIVDWDGVTHATYYSPVFREIRGCAPDADTSDWPDYFKVMIHPEDRERITGRWVAFIRGKGPEGPRGEYYAPEEYRLLRGDGGYVWVQVSGMAVRDERGFVTRWIAAVIDITERRAQRELLEQQNEALKENVRLREEVERIGRHDLKTPLNSIVAVPRLLREERKLGPEADELLGVVERAGYRILSMVNLSLDLYKMEQGTYAFRPDAVDLQDLMGKVVGDVRMHAASKRVKVQVDVAGAPYAWAEELLCYSLIANLLKNAVEASPEGGVVAVRAEAGEGGTVAIHIHNAGVVPESIRGSFFRKYATLGKASGTGLGTYSARLMARVQDGDVAMRTSEGDGTTLSVTLRAAPEGAVPATMRHAAERRGVHAAELSALPPMRVLLVDDDEYNLLIVRRFLPAPPFTVDTAINGRVALSAAELQWPDVVLMDLDMPVMGGLEAVGRLRELQRRRLEPACLIVALSSHDDDETRERALAAGFDDYLTKPVTREIVQGLLLEHHAVIGAPPAPAAAQVADAPPADPADPVQVDAEIEPILADFLASRRALVGQLVAAADGGDRGEVRRIAHLLAGSFALYGFAWAGERARWLERNFSEVAPEAVRTAGGELLHHLDTVEVRFRAADVG